MNAFERLTELFKEFPGVGPRQAGRFVYHLLRTNPGKIAELSKLIKEVGNLIKKCPKCQRFYSTEKQNGLCNICSDDNRERDKLMIVSRDSDLEAIEKSNAYTGIYFVLGGTIPILNEEIEKFIRLKELLENIKNNNYSEIIVALNANPDGDYTADYLEKLLNKDFSNIKISRLGRGLSTGTELEYSDKDTIKSALENRK